MGAINYKKGQGTVSVKLILIPLVTVLALLAGLSLNQFSMGRNNLLGQTPEVKKSEDRILVQANKAECASETKTVDKVFSAQIDNIRLRSSKYSDAAASLVRLKDYIRRIEEKNNTLNEKVNLLSNLLAAKEKELLNVSEYNGSLRENLSKAMETQNRLRADFDASLSNFNNQLKLKDTEILNLDAIKASLEAQVQDLNSKTTQMSDVYSSLQKQLALLQENKISLEMELNKLKEELVKQAAINEKLKVNLQEFSDGLNSKEKDKAAITKQVQEIETARQALASELSVIKLNESGNENQIATLNARVNELNSMCEQAKNSVLEISEALNKKNEELANKQKEFAQLKESFSKAGKEKRDSSILMAEKEKAALELNNKLEDMISQATFLQKELQIERQRQLKTQEELSEARNQNNYLKARLRDIYAQLELLSIEKNITIEESDLDRDTAIISSFKCLEKKPKR